MSFKLIFFYVFLGILAGCGGGPNTRQDRHEKISFQIPNEWEVARGSSETRFRPSAAGPFQAEIQVSTQLLEEPRDLERGMAVALDFQRKQEQAILKSETITMHGLSGVEYVHEMQTGQGASIRHQVHLQGPDFLITTYLLTQEADYRDYLPLYTEVLKSIRVLK